MQGNDGTMAGDGTKRDSIHKRIQAHLNELRTDLKQLAADAQEGRREASRARKDRVEGLKRALSDLLEAAEQADKEWK